MHNGLIVLHPWACELIYGSSQKDEIARRTRLLAEPMSRDETLAHPELLAEAEVIFTGWGAPAFDAHLLAAMPRLKAVFHGAGSIRQLVTDRFWERDILITSAYAANARPVAEYSLGVILLSLKNFWREARSAKDLGGFGESVPCAGAYRSTVGLVSLGMVGRLVRDYLRPFDLHILGYDPFVTPEQAAKLGIEMVSLDELFQRCDVVSLHTPLLKETEGMIRGHHFEFMKPHTTFLNTARGAVVREDEMIDVLRRRTDLTAWLDVTYPEPPARESPLWRMPNVVLTPHIAGSRNGECRRMGQLMLDEFDRWSRGEPLRWGISKQQAAILA